MQLGSYDLTHQERIILCALDHMYVTLANWGTGEGLDCAPQYYGGDIAAHVNEAIGREEGQKGEGSKKRIGLHVSGGWKTERGI